MFVSPLLPAPVRLDPLTGVMTPATGHYRKRMEDLAGVYSDREAFSALLAHSPHEVVYEVYEHRAVERAGDLIFGTSILYPGKVGREYNMTRGHIHRVSDRTEIYYCLKGRGVLLLESREGKVSTLEMAQGSVSYVPPHLIHRSVNISGELLVTLFCYPADAGQDYGIVEASHGMGVLVVDDGFGGWTTMSNPRYILRHE